MSVDTATGMATELPQAGTWAIDPAHTVIGFSARHLGLSRVRGQFTDFEGTIEIPEDPLGTTVRVSIRTASVTTGQQQRDEHLRSPDFLDVATFPTMDFVSTAVEEREDGYRLTGDLTIRDVTRPVTLDVEFEGTGPDPMSGGQRTAFSARTSFNREDFGLTWNAPLPTGQILVGKKVDVDLEVAATTQPVEPPEEIRDEASS